MRLLAVLAKTVPDIREYFDNKGCYTLASNKVSSSKIKNTEEVSICLFFIQAMVSSYSID